MTIHLTPEQERRIQAVISRGAYESVEEVVEAALTASMPSGVSQARCTRDIISGG
jgi:Arc/MetJ-type ribon-helix-helix transcriptional regulator